MESLHRGLLVVPKMCLKAKQSLYWLEISQVENCHTYQAVARSQLKVPEIPKEVPFRPRHKTGMILFISKMKYFISMWLICQRIQYSVYCNNVISSLESIISEYDNVEEIISDNGKQHSLAVIRAQDTI